MNDKKLQGIFHLAAIFSIPGILVSIFLLNSYLLGISIALALIVFFVLIQRKRS